MKDKNNNGFKYIKEGSGLENKIFKEFDNKALTFPLKGTKEKAKVG